mgnify:CR=1 FL=1
MIGLEKAGQLAKSLFFGNDDKSASAILLSDEEGRKAIQEAFTSEVLLDLKTKFQKRQAEKSLLELTWRLEINFYNGNQFTTIDAALNDITEIPVLADWEERNVFNEIAPNVEARFAILSKRKNNLKNRPASSSSEDRTSAKIGNKILASTKRNLGMSDLQQEANLISGLTGSAVWKTGWSSTKGKVIGIKKMKITEEESFKLSIYQYENELLGMEPDVVYQKIYEGDVLTTLRSPFEIYPENLSLPCRQNRRVMHSVLLSPDEIFDTWGIVEKGSDYDTYKVMNSDDRNYGSGVSGRMYGKTYGITKIHNVVRVYEEYELPTPRYPQGRLIIGSDNYLYHYGPLPDAMGENGEYVLPFDVQQSLKTDGFFGKSVIERMIPLQLNYNAIKNRIQDYINRVTIGVLEAEENTLVDEDYYREEGIAPGEILLYQRGAKAPRFMEMPPLPPELSAEADRLLNAMDRLSGVSQLSKQSMVPTNVTSGVAIAGLAEQDDTRIGLEAENIKNCLASVGKKWLILYRNNVAYPRMVKDIGKNDEFEISQFIGNDLTSFDVFVESEPEASDTLSQRRQKVIELLNSGLFNDTTTGNITNEGRIKVFEMLELGDWESFTEADDDQQRKAGRENNSMIVGEPARIRDFDDDVIHISMHNNFRLKAEYEEALLKNPEIDQIFEQHVNEHLMSLQTKSAAEQKMQMQNIPAEQGNNQMVFTEPTQ